MVEVKLLVEMVVQVVEQVVKIMLEEQVKQDKEMMVLQLVLIRAVVEEEELEKMDLHHRLINVVERAEMVLVLIQIYLLLPVLEKMLVEYIILLVVVEEHLLQLPVELVEMVEEEMVTYIIMQLLTLQQIWVAVVEELGIIMLQDMVVQV